MDNRTKPTPEPLVATHELRERMPDLHPYMALVLTLEPMLNREEISSEEYMRWAAMMVASQGKPLYGKN